LKSKNVYPFCKKSCLEVGTDKDLVCLLSYKSDPPKFEFKLKLKFKLAF
jgi:hypothetical protein